MVITMQNGLLVFLVKFTVFHSFSWQQYFENRVKALAAQKAAGMNPYPHKFFTSMQITEYIEKYGGLNNGDHLEDVQVSLAGR